MNSAGIENAAGGLGPIAWYVLGGYLLLLLVLGVAGFLKSRGGEEDYYLAGRGQGWLVTALTIMATFFSSFALLGAPGMVYRDGVVFALFALNVPMGGAAIYYLGSRIARIGRARGYVTPADMIGDYYGSPVALRLLVALVGLLYALPYVVIQIKAGGFLAEEMFPGAHAYELGATILAAVTMLYIMVGGMRSVAWTDVVQGILLVGGMLVVGAATVVSLGGPRSFFAQVAQLPARSLTVPGTSGTWTPEKLFTVCLFASLGSMIQPAQWMRYYAADSTRTLRRSALLFTVVLTACFLLGVMLVGLGGQVVYPLVDDAGAYRLDEAGRTLPHPDVGTAHDHFDRVLITMTRTRLPLLLGGGGTLAAALILTAILAASMSTADSNLHAVSAVFTRDIYDRFVRPAATPQQRTRVGRGVIAVTTLAALGLVLYYRGDRPGFNPMAMIATLGLLAIAFSSQLLPVTFDMLFVQRGTRAGAVCGIVAGVAVVLALSPFGKLFTGDEGAWHERLAALRTIVDTGAWGLFANLSAFALVSCCTRKVDAAEAAEFGRLARGEEA